MKANTAVPKKRIEAIDILRAITVALMIFVNDLPGIRDIPHWLGHIPAGEDGMYLADIVFPLFLFWVGMSIPLAIDGRQKKGEDTISILKHILKRTAGLVFIGVLMVNTGSLDSEMAGIDRNLWALLMYSGVIMAWRVYGKETTVWGRRLGVFVHCFGIALLIFVVMVFRNDEGGWLSPQWWGILGLIGWAYIVAALAYLFLRKRTKPLWVTFVLLMLYHMAYAQIPWLREQTDWLAMNSYGAHATLTFAGLLATLIIRRYQFEYRKLYLFWGSLALVFVIAGFALRPLWGIAKIGATPSWVYLSLGVGFAILIMVWHLTEIKGRSNWAKIFYPAGPNTFLAYLLPSLYYHFIWLVGISYPQWLSQSWGGLIRAIVFSILMIQLTGLLARWGIKLKL